MPGWLPPSGRLFYRRRMTFLDRTSAALLCLTLVVAGCSSREEPGGGGTDAGGSGTDAGGSDTDAGMTGTDAGTDAGVDVDAGPLTGDSYFYVVSFMDLGAPEEGGDPNIVPGFDIDGLDSDGTDLQSCRKRDYTSPPPESEMGVDNQLGPVLADLEGMYGIRENLESSVQMGELLVLLEVRGVDDLVDDDRVELDAFVGVLPAGATTPGLDGDGHLAPGQTFDIDRASLMTDGETPSITLRGRITDGRLHVGPGDFTLSLPLEGERVEFEAKQAEVVFDITAEALGNGVMGGSLSVEGTLEAMMGVEGFNVDAARLVLESNADLDRDDATADCLSISIALVFLGAEATRGEIVDVP